MKYSIYLTLTALIIQLTLVATQSLGFRESFGHERCITAAMVKSTRRSTREAAIKAAAIKAAALEAAAATAPSRKKDKAEGEQGREQVDTSPDPNRKSVCQLKAEESQNKHQDSEEACSEMPSENKENSPPSKSPKRVTTRAATKIAAAAGGVAVAPLAAAADKARGKQVRKQVDASNVESPDLNIKNVYRLDANKSKNCSTKTKYKKQDKATKYKASDETNEQVRQVNVELLRRALDDCNLSKAILCYHNPSLLPKILRTAFTKEDNITPESISNEYKLSAEDIIRFNQYLASNPRRSDGNASDDARDDAAVGRADDEADESAVDNDYVEVEEKELDYMPDDLLEDSAHASDEDLESKKRHSQKSLKVSIFLLSLT